MAQGRRWLSIVPRLTRRAWEDVARELEEYLRRLWQAESDGIPSGFRDRNPNYVQASSSTADLGDPGTETEGWAAADHRHVAATGVPVEIGDGIAEGEGSSTSLSRADHKHKVKVLRTAGLTVDAGGSVVSAGFKGYIPSPYSGTIESWEIRADQVGDCVVDVWKAWRTPTITDSICGVTKPQLSAEATASGDATGWTNLTVTTGEIFGFNVDSAATVTLVTLVVTVREA